MTNNTTTDNKFLFVPTLNFVGLEKNPKINKQNKINLKNIAVPRNLWQEAKSAHTWKTDFRALKRNSASLQLYPDIGQTSSS